MLYYISTCTTMATLPHPAKDIMAAEEPIKSEAAPPAYNAPPTYAEVFGVKEIQGHIQEARAEGGNPAKAGVKICNVLCGSVVCGVCVVVFAALPIAMIIIGSLYFYDCQISRLVPIFLIVFGCVSLVQTAIHIFRMICGHRKDERSERANQGSNCCETLITVFLIVWIIVGSYWVFSLWSSWDQNPSNCHPVLVYFSFITLLVIYGTAILFFFCIVCCMLCCTFLAACGAAAS